MLSGIQQQHHLVAAQAAAGAVAGRHCGSCGRARARKDTRHIVLRTLFGTLRLESPRFRACPCALAGPATVSPVAALLPERTTPELLLWEARYAALTSYAAAASLLSEAFPLGRTLQPTAVRQQVERTATRLEDELGEERFSFIDTCLAEWEEMPRPGLPLVVALDGGYVHSRQQTSRRTAGRGGHRHQHPRRRRPRQDLRLRPDLRRQAQTQAVRAAALPGDAGQPAGRVPHRRQRGNPRPAPLPPPAGRALPGLVPRHHAADRAAPDDPVPAAPARRPGR